MKPFTLFAVWVLPLKILSPDVLKEEGEDLTTELVRVTFRFPVRLRLYSPSKFSSCHVDCGGDVSKRPRAYLLRPLDRCLRQHLVPETDLDARGTGKKNGRSRISLRRAAGSYRSVGRLRGPWATPLIFCFGRNTLS